MKGKVENNAKFNNLYFFFFQILNAREYTFSSESTSELGSI